MVIGRERLRQILHERGISFQRTRTRKESRDPDRGAKLGRSEYVTSHYPDRCFAFDQFGPLSIRPCHGTCWALRKHPVRLRATYHRTHGIRYFHGCYGLGGRIDAVAIKSTIFFKPAQPPTIAAADFENLRSRYTVPGG